MTTPPQWINGVELNDLTLRRGAAMLLTHNGTALGARAGVVPGGGGLLVTVSGTTITVSTGGAWVYQSGQGVYQAVLQSARTLTLTAAHATLPRIDLVYLRVWDDAVDGSGLTEADPVYLAGTASSTPSAPTPAGTVIYLPLATISVPASGGGSPSVSQSIRPYTVAPGGILPSTTAPSSPYTGQYYDNGTDLLRYNGSSWDTYTKVQTVPWITASLATGYTHNGNDNGTAQYRKIVTNGGDFVQWRGGLNLTYSGSTITHGADFLASALSSTYRPLSRRTVLTACSAVTSAHTALRINFDADGTTSIADTGAGTTPPWLSLNGVMYSVD